MRSISVEIWCVFEATFVAVLALIIVVRGGTLGHFSGEPFNPGAATLGFAGLSFAAIFAFLSIAGVDGIAPVAEESHTPRRLIPLATILMTLIAGAYWNACLIRIRHLRSCLDGAGLRDRRTVDARAADRPAYIGGWAVLVPITGFTAAVASFGASLYAASRIAYAVAREGSSGGTFPSCTTSSRRHGGLRSRRS
jgi:amino acid transporter